MDVGAPGVPSELSEQANELSRMKEMSEVSWDIFLVERDGLVSYEQSKQEYKIR